LNSRRCIHIYRAVVNRAKQRVPKLIGTCEQTIFIQTSQQIHCFTELEILNPAIGSCPEPV